MSPLLTVLADDLVEPVAPGWQLITATLVGIALLVLLITVVKLNPFLALILGGLTVGAIAGENLSDVITSFTTGFGTTVASVGVLIALGAIFASCWRSRVAPTRWSTRSWAGRRDGRCRGRWPRSGRSSGCRCSSRSASCC